MNTEQVRGAVRSLALVAALVAPVAGVAQDKTTRAELGRADNASDSQTETIVSELRLMPGAYVPLHTHPGDEHIYVVNGGPLTTKDGKTIEFKSGAYVYFPRGQLHGGLTASGEGELVLVTVHVVDKGKPVYEFAE